jgi:hypothetical protein
VIAFCHIEKTAGTALNRLLYRHFGARHCVVRPWASKGGQPEEDRSFTAEDLAGVRRIHPGLRSLSGHSIRPWSDLQDVFPEVRLYTFLRDPIERTISHYQHRVRYGQTVENFEEWISEPQRHNRQVTFLAGKPDLSRAREILQETMEFVGFPEHFQQSLHLLADRFNLRFSPSELKIRNRSRNYEIRESILADRRKMELLEEANALDLKLYAFALDTFYNSGRSGGGCRRVEGASADLPMRPFEKLRRDLNYLLGISYRKLVYRPALFLYQALGRRRSPGERVL